MNGKDFEKLVFGMAHQIRNPCAIILSNANLLIQQPDLKPEIRRSIESIINGAKYLESRLAEFTEFSKPVVLNLNKVSIRKLFNDAAALLKDKCRLKMIKISSDLPQDVVLQADFHQIFLAVLNVLLNSVEAIDHHGAILLKGRLDGGRAIVEIEDTGMGIHPRDLPEVFSPFYSTKPGGVGIGLAVAKRVSDAHLGKMELKSRHGKGTVVTITLPAQGPGSRG